MSNKSLGRCTRLLSLLINSKLLFAKKNTQKTTKTKTARVLKACEEIGHASI